VSPVFTLNVNGAVPPAIGVYTIFPDMNSLLSVKLTTNGNAACAVFQNLPLNKEVELLIYSKINNRFVQCKRKIVVTRGMVIPVDFTAVSDEQVKKVFLNQPAGA
jgi:hypothetical protein